MISPVADWQLTALGSDGYQLVTSAIVAGSEEICPVICATTHVRKFSQAFVGDGRRPLVILALGLGLSGLLALFLAVTGQFLPHDERFLGMTAEELCALHGCRIVHFMIHDRVSFGGALVAIAVLYLWLARFPLRQGQAWAWWLFLVSGLCGFGSFFAYLAYGYFDSWHAVATVALLSCFGLGLLRSWGTLSRPRSISSLLRISHRPGWLSPHCLGRALLLGSSAAMIVAGLTILVVGMTCVFVPQDLGYLGLPVEELQALNPRLVPLIAHDRAGFGGAVACCGITLFFCVWCGNPSASLWRVLAVAGTVGFATAIGIHPAIGYNDTVHLAPAVLGALCYFAGLALTFRPMTHATPGSSDAGPKLAPKAASTGNVPSEERLSVERCSNRTVIRVGDQGLPSLRDLGHDLLHITCRQRLMTLSAPFACFGAYFAFASLGWWPFAVLSVAALNFVTYGSTSHDLVHQDLGLSRRMNDWLLCLVELLAIRSGHAYQRAHLHHHARYPNLDDIEGAASRMSWPRALAEGVVFPFRIWWWARAHTQRGKVWLYSEAIACLSLVGLAVLLVPLTPVFVVYVVLIVAGAWLNPFVTAYLPHDSNGRDALSQTRLFRGRVASVVAWEHLYHLEHHLYPAVPHHNWPRLASRLNPYLEKAGVRPVKFWF